MMTINALAAADSVIIPSQPSYLSTKGLSLLMGSIAKVRKQINPYLFIEGVLLTMVDNRTTNAKSIIASLRQTGDMLRVFNTEIPFSVRAAETSNEGISIFAHDGKGPMLSDMEVELLISTHIAEIFLGMTPCPAILSSTRRIHM